MRRIRRTWPLSTVGLLIVLTLAAGCYRPAAPDVGPTPGSEGEQAALTDEEIIATSRAEATRAAEEEAAAQAAEEPTLLGPTQPPATQPPATQPPEEPTAVPQPAATEAEPTAVPTQPAPTSPPQPQPTTASPGVHVVQRGENLFRIALRYGTTVEAIAAANNITDPTQIYAGQRLVIPGSGAQPGQPTTGGTTYVVKAGDNLYRIALRFGLSYWQLAQYNGISNPNAIYAGQTLRIPPR